MALAPNLLLRLRKLRPGERRTFGRYQLPLSRLVEVHWEGRLLPLAPAPQHENISALGLCLCLGAGPLPPVGAELDIRFPLAERPAQSGRVYARCRGRVVRHNAPNLLAVYFDDVAYVRDEVRSGLPVLDAVAAGDAT